MEVVHTRAVIEEKLDKKVEGRQEEKSVLSKLLSILWRMIVLGICCIITMSGGQQIDGNPYICIPIIGALCIALVMFVDVMEELYWFNDLTRGEE